MKKYAFKMTVFVGVIKYIGYYIYDENSQYRQFNLCGIVRIGTNTPIYYLRPDQRNLDHMDRTLSYSALNTRARRVKTYSVERVLVKDIQNELDTLENEMFLAAIS